jgi:hypothetical protein
MAKKQIDIFYTTNLPEMLNLKTTINIVYE